MMTLHDLRRQSRLSALIAFFMIASTSMQMACRSNGSSGSSSGGGGDIPTEEEAATDPAIESETIARDASGRPTQITHDDGSVTTIAYRHLDVSQVCESNGSCRNYEYNALRQPSTIIETYEAPTTGASQVSKVNARVEGTTGRTFNLEWHGLGTKQPKRIEQVDANGTILSAVEWDYNARGLKTEARRIDVVNNVTKRETYTYNRLNDLVEVVLENGETLRYGYNKRGDLTSITYPNGASIDNLAFNYSPVFPGRLDGVVQGTQQIDFGYDEAGDPYQLVSELRNTGTGTVGLTYDYDAAGRLSEVKIGDTILAQMTYDENGRMTALTDVVGTHTLAYIENSALIDQIAHPWGTMTQSYDPATERVTQALNETATGAIVSRFDYTYDENGRVESLLKVLEGVSGTAQNAVYNAANMLTGFGTETFGYDALGRLNETNGAAGGVSMTLNGLSELTALVSRDSSGTETTKTVSTDASGNLTNDGDCAYTYDVLSRLTSRTCGDDRVEISYDPFSNPAFVTTRASGDVTDERYLVWYQDRVVEERDLADLSLRRTYSTYGVKESDGTKRFIVRDRLNSPIALLDSTGATQATFDYSAFGRETLASGDAGEFNQGFTGHYKIDENLLLAHYRAYLPTLGRWTSLDPLTQDGFIDRYAYVKNDPLNAIDRDGRIAIAIPAVVITAAMIKDAVLITGSLILGKLLIDHAMTDGSCGDIAFPPAPDWDTGALGDLWSKYRPWTPPAPPVPVEHIPSPWETGDPLNPGDVKGWWEEIGKNLWDDLADWNKGVPMPDDGMPWDVPDEPVEPNDGPYLPED